ncbi:PREDICTED: GDSL [Prunus dulcis]|uniref:PREDICTED: GDSL n=1 Tax=Prunus dulcis TaxID=3755 RepID=A0A5E4FQ85_PRUDU|nr:PREDICTED: GDSL [Prunus dulcis]
MGLKKFTPPYLAPTAVGDNLLQGVNYASSSSGISNFTGFLFVNNRRDTRSVALSFDSAGSEDTKVEVISESVRSVPTFGKGKGLMTGQAVPLAAVPYCVQSASASQYCEFLMRDTRAPDHHVSYQSETSSRCSWNWRPN